MITTTKKAEPPKEIVKKAEENRKAIKEEEKKTGQTYVIPEPTNADGTPFFPESDGILTGDPSFNDNVSPLSNDTENYRLEDGFQF